MAKSKVETKWIKNDLPKLQAKLKEANLLHVAIGVNQAQGTKKKEGDDSLTVADVATFHEFGTVNVPERSFIRSNDINNREKYKKIQNELGKKVIYMQIEPEKALGLLGEAILADMKKGIVDGIGPNLDPKTIERKGSSTPLIDTAQLLNSLTYKVVKT